MRTKYAVFQGGGVKGIALVGALAKMQKENVQFQGYAGTSAGAIVASLAAVGYPAWDPEGPSKNPPTKDMRKIMEEMQDLQRFLDGRDEIPLQRLQALHQLPDVLLPVLGDIGAEYAALERDGIVGRLVKAGTEAYTLIQAGLGCRSFWRLRKLWKQCKPDVQRLQGVIEKHAPRFQRVREFGWLPGLAERVVSGRGVYGTDSFMQWMRGHLEHIGPRDPDTGNKVTFGAVSNSGVTLKVVATDLSIRRERIYSTRKTTDVEVARGVVASMSIPLFFQPCPDFDGCLVDGGVVSNYPLWAFDDEIKEFKKAQRQAGGEAPEPLVVGFRLVLDDRNVSSEPIRSFGQFARALWNTLLEGTDQLHTGKKIENLAGNLVTVNIPIDPQITATKLNLSDPEREKLFWAGYQAAKGVLDDPRCRNLLDLPPRPV